MRFPEQYRSNNTGTDLIGRHWMTKPGDGFGAFHVPAHKAPKRRQLNIIACDGKESGWDHVSVSLGPTATTPPTWDEMCFVKDLFWDEEDCVMQFHPAKNDYVNFHPGVLHLWKPTAEFPKPPKIFV